MAFDVAECRQDIVEPHADAECENADGITAVNWKDKGERLDQVRCQAAAQQVAFPAGDVDQAQLAVLQISDTAVDQL